MFALACKVGSFRDAVSHSNRNIVFYISGYIQLKTAVFLCSDLTNNGQCAPGNGIRIMGGEILASDKYNIILRQWDSIDAVAAFGAHVEKGLSTFYCTLWVSAHNRQPLSKDNIQYVNSVVYNYQAAYTSAKTGGFFSHDISNNYLITGLSTTSSKNAFCQMTANQSVHAAGDYIDSNKDGQLNRTPDNTVGSSTILSKPWADTSPKLATMSAADAVAFVMNVVKSFGTEGTLYRHQEDTGISNGGYGTL
ncbi:polysaccharide lyase family 1 protein [Trichoderma barbatum]